MIHEDYKIITQGSETETHLPNNKSMRYLVSCEFIRFQMRNQNHFDPIVKSKVALQGHLT